MAAEKKRPSADKHILAGGLAGAMEISVMYPTEFVKTQMQLQKSTGGAPRFKNSLDCARVIVAEKGPFGLYRGLTSLLAGTVPKTSVRFGVYGQLKNLLRDKETGTLSAGRTFLAGAMTGFIEATLIVTPVETMKTILVQDGNSPNPRFKGLFHGMKTIVAEEGLGGIYRGVAPTIAKQMGNQAVRFTTFESIKKTIAGDSKGPIPGWKSFVAGGTAGIVSVLVTMPFDVVKTRMQGIDAKMYRGAVDCVRQTYQKEGVFAFWKGTAARLPRVAFGQSITLAGYDQIVGILNRLY